MDHTTLIAASPNRRGGPGSRLPPGVAATKWALSCGDAAVRILVVPQRRGIPIPCWGDKTRGEPFAARHLYTKASAGNR
jgi:hypothetical protein